MSTGLRAGYKQTELGVIPVDWHAEEVANLVEPTAPICYGVVQVGKYTENGVPIVAIKFVKEIAHAPFIELPLTSNNLTHEAGRKAGMFLSQLKEQLGALVLFQAGFRGTLAGNWQGYESARIRAPNTSHISLNLVLLNNGLSRQ